LGISILVRPEYIKVHAPIVVTLFGMVILVKPLQPWKVPSLVFPSIQILITLLGISILVILLQPQKAYLLILVTSSSNSIVPTPFSNVWETIVVLNLFVCKPLLLSDVVSVSFSLASYTMMLLG
jgi:hypothetical protein